jgi:hypothetical protein
MFTDAATDPSPQAPTFDELTDLVNRHKLAGKLVYAVWASLEPGVCLTVKESDMHYGYIVFQSQRDAERTAASLGLTLLHLKDAPHKPVSMWKPVL